MLLKLKKKTLPLLKKENILTGCTADDKEKVIRRVGQMLVDDGYVKPDYVEAMLEREETFATNMGNGIALPHGVERAKAEIKASGIAVMVFPEGTDWNGEKVKIVIGIAGVGDEHLEILANIAEKLCEEEAVEELVGMDVDGIYEFMTSREE